MAIRLTPDGFWDLREHIGHKIECVCYGAVDVEVEGGVIGKDPVNIALECEDCGCVLVDFDHPGVEGEAIYDPVGENPFPTVKGGNKEEDNAQVQGLPEAATKRFQSPLLSSKTDVILKEMRKRMSKELVTIPKELFEDMDNSIEQAFNVLENIPDYLLDDYGKDTVQNLLITGDKVRVWKEEKR